MPSERRAVVGFDMMKINCLALDQWVFEGATLVVHALVEPYFRPLIGYHVDSTGVFVRCWLDCEATVEGMNIDLYSEQRKKAFSDMAIVLNCRRRCWVIESRYWEVVEGAAVEEAYGRDAVDIPRLDHGKDLGGVVVGI